MLHGCLTKPKVLKTWTQMAHTQNSPPNTRILHKGLGSHKEWLGRAQEAVEILCRWSGTSNPWERGWSAFYMNLDQLVVGAIKTTQLDRFTISIKPVWRFQTSSGHSLKKSLLDDKFGLGPGHVRRRAGHVRWCSNSNGHIGHWICMVQDQTCLKNASEIW
jgi:hypothetical protein